ncbi:DNA polymerase III subunit chi [Sphingomonas mesophila]|uniref:DNA polymerase III subunit chi n=1 Tax=Sphingomonas mesophila TaxID=2303576 RepID=UPI0023DD7AB0|nr:DNA polymerase III subunit chi [Sphingomonas mesophila]
MACACSTSSWRASRARRPQVRVDFYQLGSGAGPDSVIARIATRLLDENERLLVVADDEALLARLDRLLWEAGRTSFLPHGIAGGADDARQPILLSTGIDAPNGARHLLIADGVWREAAQHFERTFFLFDEAGRQPARAAWKALGSESERHYWANEDGKWVEKG